MNTQQVTTVDMLAQQLGLTEDGRATLERAIKVQQQIDKRQDEIDALITARRADVATLFGKHRLTKYRISKILGVSQTTIGNIMRDVNE